MIRLAVALLLMQAHAAPAPPIELTLEKSVSIALDHATTVLKSQNTERLAGEALLQSYAQFLPNLTATAQYVWASGRTLYTISALSLVDQSGRSSAFALTSTLNLFNGLSDWAGLKAALARKDAAKLSLTRARELVAIDVTQTYLQVVLDQDVIRIAERNYAASAEREKLFRVQAQVGQRTLADMYRQVAQTKSDQAFLIASRTRLHDDQLLLLRKLQLDLTQDYLIVPPKSDTSTNPKSQRVEKELIDYALKNRPDLKAQGSALEASRWDITGARSGYYPRLDVGASFHGAGDVLSHQSVNGIDFGALSQNSLLGQLTSQTGYSVGLYLTWNLFDRFLTSANVERADVAASNTEIDYNDLKLQVTQEVRQIYGDYKASADQLSAAREGAQAAEKAYEVIRGRYSVGASSFIDLLTAQAAMVQSDVALAQATLAYMLQGRQLDYALGDL